MIWLATLTHAQRRTRRVVRVEALTLKAAREQAQRRCRPGLEQLAGDPTMVLDR